MNIRNTKIVTTYVLAAIIIFFAVNIFSSVALNRFRFDMTSDNVYTLSDGTIDVLQNMNEQVTLRLFFSNELANGYPNLKSYADRVRGLLEQMADYSDGNVRLKVINPEPFSEEEDLAVSLGLKGVPVDQSGEMLYFGISAANSVDDVQSIPFLPMDRERFLEYDIIRMVNDLASPVKKKIGLISSVAMSYDVQGGQEQAYSADWSIIHQLRQMFDVKTLSSELKAIPKDIDVLLVVKPASFSVDTLNAVDQFVLKGGNAIVFADPLFETPLPEGKQDNYANLSKMFAGWGIKMPSDKIVADRVAAKRGGNNSFAMDPGISMLTYLGLDEENFNSSDILSANLRKIMMSSSGYIEKRGDVKTQIIPLISSGKNSMRVDKRVLINDADNKDLVMSFEPENTEFTMAARVTGEAVSAFPEYSADDGYVASSVVPLNVVVLADVDMLRDAMWVSKQRVLGYSMLRQFADNGSFVANAVDNLTGSDALISLRTRAVDERPFEVVEELRRNAERKFLSREQDLKEELRITEQRLAKLMEAGGVGSEVTLDSASRSELERFQEEVVRIRKELRSVRRELDVDIESLGFKIKLFNIGFIPIIIIFLAIYMFVYHSKKKQRS